MFCILITKRLRWLGHVIRMDDGRIPKDLLFGELATGGRPTGRATLRYKDVCKRDLKAGLFNSSQLEATALDRNVWRGTTKNVVNTGEDDRNTRWREKR